MGLKVGVALLIGLIAGSAGTVRLLSSTPAQVQRVAKSDNRTAVEIRRDMNQ